MTTYWLVKPGHSRTWHAAWSWGLLRGGVTLCRRTFEAIDANLKHGGGALELVECEPCRVVLENDRKREEATA